MHIRFLSLFFFFFLNQHVFSLNNQEDLSISTYSHIGCLILNSDKEFLSNYIQENFLLPYQTFSSSNLTIELCFRICRRWLILINNNHTNCICLYTINELYEIHEHLGEILSINNCNSNTLKIYSLTKDSYLLPSLLSSNYDWSFDGCYHLYGIETYHANHLFNDTSYNQAIDLCRNNCQSIRSQNYFSFFVSLRKYCYCLPIKLSESILPTAIRKPLIHCSFLSYVKNAFENSLNFSQIHFDTVIKINVQRYCSSFIFNRNLYICFKIVSSNITNTYSKISPNDSCSPVLIKTSEQWNYFLSLPVFSHIPTFIWIDQNSTYIINDVFKLKLNSSISNHLCLVIYRNQTLSFDLISCSTLYTPSNIFCSQKPSESISADHAQFKSAKSLIPIMNNVTCPIDFILFNNKCYYVDTLFVDNIQKGEQICTEKYLNSSLMNFNSHEWGNVNSTRFLGRIFNDILLEFFYYQLENKFLIDIKNPINKKHWLRLLISEKNTSNECVLRYFNRSLGGFTIIHRCNDSGHPVCQSEPILINENEKILSNLSNISIYENSTDPIPDEDIINHETNIEYISNNITSRSKKQSSSSYRSLLMIASGPLLALSIFLIGIIFLLRYVRQNHGSYSTHNIRKKHSSKITKTSNDTTNTPNVLYTRLQSSPPSIIIDTDMIEPFDDNVQLLPQSTNQTNLNIQN